MTENQDLLAEYVRTGSDAAFRELVSRYLDLVYSTALRLVGGDVHRAEDVAQIVFSNFARVARTLPSDVKLGGWLHRDTCFAASTLMRGERRRELRERRAVEMKTLDNTSEANYAAIAPILDGAINRLDEADRTAILMRFFEEQDFRSIGQALSSSEDAARMRVKRALEKLEALLRHRGITTTATSLGVILSSQAVQAAPVGLALTISAATAAAAIGGTSIATAATVTATATKAIAMTAIQKTVLAATIAVLTGAGIYQAHEASKMRQEVRTLRRQQTVAAEEIARLNVERQALIPRLDAAQADSERRNDHTAELLKLRNELGRMKAAANESRLLQDDPVVQKALKENQNYLKLRELLSQMSHHRIPELGLLGEESYRDVAKSANLDSDIGIRTAFSELRFLAENQAAHILQTALGLYMQSNDQPPQRIADLAPYCDPPLSESIFDRYEVLLTGTNVAGGWKGGWVLSQKHAVDSELDKRLLISPVGFSNDDFSPRSFREL